MWHNQLFQYINNIFFPSQLDFFFYYLFFETHILELKYNSMVGDNIQLWKGQNIHLYIIKYMRGGIDWDNGQTP